MSCCSICLEQISEDEGFCMLACTHKLHIDCAIRLAACGQRHGQFCPVCRQQNVLPIVTTDHHIVTVQQDNVVQEDQRIQTNIFASALISFMLVIAFALIIKVLS